MSEAFTFARFFISNLMSLVHIWREREWERERERESCSFCKSNYPRNLQHSGFLHVALSSWALLFFGPQVESVFGSLAFGMIYFLGGLCGNTFSYFFTPAATVGGTVRFCVKILMLSLYRQLVFKLWFWFWFCIYRDLSLRFLLPGLLTCGRIERQ